MGWQRPGHGPTAPLIEYQGQFAGFVRNGQQWIYASYVSEPLAAADSTFSTQAAVWCGGGGTLFGVEYHPATGRFADLERNGLDQLPEAVP